MRNHMRLPNTAPLIQFSPANKTGEGEREGDFHSVADAAAAAGLSLCLCRVTLRNRRTCCHCCLSIQPNIGWIRYQLFLRFCFC